MRAEDFEILCNLKKLQRQVDIAVKSFETEMKTFPSSRELNVNKGYEIGDFVITPRFPKIDFRS